MNKSAFSTLIGTPIDLSPWGYPWRADRAIQEKPEADFIPHRLNRIDTAYRCAKADLGVHELRPICYHQRDIMADFPEKPADPLLAGLLWVGGVNTYQVELVFPEGAEVDESKIEVRTYPTAWGWFGWTVDRILERTKVEDGKWIYVPDENDTIDYSYNVRVKAQTEMVAVFAPQGTPIPQIRITGESLGTWKEMTFTVEWGFAQDKPDYDSFFGHVALIADPVIDQDAKKATFTALYSDVSRFGNDSRITVVTDPETNLGATVLLRDLARGPICVPEAGLYFAPEGCDMDARAYIEAHKDDKTIRTRVSEHPEAHDWEELIRSVRLWRCPDGTELPPFPQAPAPACSLIVPDKRWQTMYELACQQLRGHHMWGHLGSEVFRVSAAMELVGLNEYADKIYDYFLASPGCEHDADYKDVKGSLEWGRQMRHGMAYAHEGCHFSTGGLLYSMMQRYLMKADKQWVTDRLPRLKEAANWIIRTRLDYMEGESPEREKLHVKGLMPPCYLGDYALPASDWRWYYNDNAASYQGLNTFAMVLTAIGDSDAAYYTAQAEDFKKDIEQAMAREALLAPVRALGDGMSRSFIPRMAYCGGLLLYKDETNVPQFANGINDMFQGALPLGDSFAPIDPNDRRLAGTVDAMEEMGMKYNISDLEQLAHPTATEEDRIAAEKLAAESAAATRTNQPPEKDDVWFWNTFSNLPKIAHNGNIYLRQDDIPSFLRFFFNHAIVMVGSNGMMWEHAHPDIYVDCDNPDNGTAGWFVEHFRYMLLMEEDDALWIAKATPRAWLEDGKEIAVQAAPTLWGDLTYQITSNVDADKIEAVIDTPARSAVPAIKLRFRHPTGAKITAITANVDATVMEDGETILIETPQGKIEIVAQY